MSSFCWCDTNGLELLADINIHLTVGRDDENSQPLPRGNYNDDGSQQRLMIFLERVTDKYRCHFRVVKHHCFQWPTTLSSGNP